jgi:hypothetical protein
MIKGTVEVVDSWPRWVGGDFNIRVVFAPIDGLGSRLDVLVSLIYHRVGEALEFVG